MASAAPAGRWVGQGSRRVRVTDDGLGGEGLACWKRSTPAASTCRTCKCHHGDYCNPCMSHWQQQAARQQLTHLHALLHHIPRVHAPVVHNCGGGACRTQWGSRAAQVSRAGQSHARAAGRQHVVIAMHRQQVPPQHTCGSVRQRVVPLLVAAIQLLGGFVGGKVERVAGPAARMWQGGHGAVMC